MSLIRIHQAILSVYDKTGIVRLAKALTRHNIQILSTGGTGKALFEAGISYQEVSDYTGSPEMLGGRVKTLHPKIHGGILFKREDQQQANEAARYGIHAVDMVAVNLYPFEATISKPNVTLDEACENIDIGGPTMIRAAAKNAQSVVTLTDPEDYDTIITELNDHGGITWDTRLALAAKAFAHTSHYDQTITNYLHDRV